ncbi:MAG: hypothetical protein WDO18_11185 [Acidobacteriota bacterium]
MKSTLPAATLAAAAAFAALLLWNPTAGAQAPTGVKGAPKQGAPKQMGMEDGLTYFKRAA